MAGGKMQCCGSPLFLSRSYGVGFTLTVVGSGENAEDLRRLVHSRVNGACLVNEAATETIFRIPIEEKSKIPELVRALESEQSRLGITSFEVGSTTLEEVFLEVAREAHSTREEMHTNRSRPEWQNFLSAGKGSGDKATSPAPIWTQFLLMFKMNWSNIKHRTGKKYEFGIPLKIGKLPNPRSILSYLSENVLQGLLCCFVGQVRALHCLLRLALERRSGVSQISFPWPLSKILASLQQATVTP
jgi:hypothetical protein